MKIQYSSLLLCLLALANSAFAADVLVINTFTSTDCSGEGSKRFLELANTCFPNGPSGSGIYTCNPVEAKSFSSNDCSGEPSGTSSVEGCDNSAGTTSSTAECQTLADNRIATVTQGVSCDEDGKLTGGSVGVLTIIDECIASGSSEKSFKITVGDADVLNISVFTASKECDGASTKSTIKVGVCKSVPGLVAGSSADEAFVVIEARLEGTKLGNNAMTESVNLLVLVIAMVGAMVTMA